MKVIQKVCNSGITFKDLSDFINECKEKNLPEETPVKISQHTTETLNDVVDIQADEESIIFYDWL